MPTFTQEVELPAAAPRVWLAFKDSKVLLPKIAPQLIASIDVQGTDDTIGAVRTVKFGSTAPEGAFVKEKVTAVDEANFCFTTEEVEGGHLHKGFTKWAPTIKFTPVDDKTCKLIASVEYEGQNEGAIVHAKEGFVKLFKGVAGYVNASGAYA